MTEKLAEEIKDTYEKLKRTVDNIEDADEKRSKRLDKKVEKMQDYLDKLEAKMQETDDLKSTVEELNEKLNEQIEKTEEKTEELDKLKKKVTERLPFEDPDNDMDPEKKKEMKAKRKAFINYARKGLTDMNPDHKKDLTSLSDSSGGYTVPADYREELLQSLPDESVMRGLCTVVNTGRDKVQIPKLDGTFSWTWGDGTSLPSPNNEDPYELITINVKNAGGLIKMTQNLLEDSVFDVEGHISEEFAESLGLEEDEVVIGGNGSDEPEGILSNAEILNNYVTTTSTSGSVDADDIIDMLYEVEQKYARNGSLLVRRKMVRTLRKLKDGEGQYLWEPSLQEGEPATFDGVPIVQPSVSNLDNAVSTDNYIAIFGDFSYYWIVDRIDMTMQRFNEKYAPLIGLYFRMRRGGKVVLPEAFQVLKVS